MGNNKILIVIDMQNDFIDGSLGTREAQKIVHNVAAKIDEYRKSGEVIIFTRDTHMEDYLNTKEGKHLPIEHCIRNSKGWNIVDDIKVGPRDRIIDKESFGFYDWANINELWDDSFLDEVPIEICGLCTDICVISNAIILKALYPERPISVLADCCAGSSPKAHEAAIEVMKSCQINIIEK